MSSPTKPTIVILHGAWHSPAHWQPLRVILEAQGYPTICPDQPSTGATPPSVPLYDDAKIARSEIESLVDAGKDVVVVMHSYGGVVGTEAVVEELGKKHQQSKGLPGGVIRLLYVCAFVLPVGLSLAGQFGGSLPPWIVLESDGSCNVPTAAEQFYHDLPPAEQKHWVGELKHHSTVAQVENPVTNAAYKFIPSTYLFCEEDRAMPLVVQQMMARDSGVEMATETCAGSHSPFLSMPEAVAGVIRRAAGEVDVK